MTTTEELPRRVWTHEEYRRLGEFGFFREQRVELLDGMILLLPSKTAGHHAVIDSANRLFRGLLPEVFKLRIQSPLTLGPATETEPDLVISEGDYPPGSIALILEIGDETLDYDRTRKANLYASVGVPDYWVVNLVTPQIEVYRDPVADPTQPFGARYTTRTDYLPGSVVAPLAFPSVQIPVVNVLP